MTASIVSFNRPSNTTAYTAGDVVGAADTATAANAGSAVLSFPVGVLKGGEIIITTSTLQIDAASVPAGMTTFRLHLYSVAPTAILDNAAWELSSAGDKAAYLGFVDLGTPAVNGSVLFIQTTGINKHIQFNGGASSSGGNVGVYGQLVTTAGFTPASGTNFRVTLNAVSAV